jgi:hypothetical protein
MTYCIEVECSAVYDTQAPDWRPFKPSDWEHHREYATWDDAHHDMLLNYPNLVDAGQLRVAPVESEPTPMYFNPALPSEPFRLLGFRLFKDGLNMTHGGTMRGAEAVRLWDETVKRTFGEKTR